MFPQMPSTFFNWLSTVQMKVIKTTAVDYEAQENTISIPVLEMVIEPMSPRAVERKPEGERLWKWLDAWCKQEIIIDTELQAPDGKQYRVQSVNDWSAAGFWKAELVQSPYGL